MMPVSWPLGLSLRRGVHRAHQRLELVVADLDEVVAGGDLALLPRLVGDGGLDDLADGLLAHAGDELLHDVEGDVGLEERDADVAQRLVDQLGGDLALARRGGSWRPGSPW